MAAEYGKVKGPNPEEKELFLKEVFQAMKKHKVSHIVCIYSQDEMVHNTYMPVAEPDPFYENLSDGIQAWLTQGKNN